MQYSQKGYQWFAKVISRIKFLTWDTDAARNPFQAILRAVSGHCIKIK